MVSSKKETIAITGASGFVGSNLIDDLKASGTFDILTIGRTNADTSYDNFISSDIEYDAIIHLAGKAHDLKKVSQPEEYFLVNCDLTCRIFDNFLRSKAKIFIYISSVKAVADSLVDVVTEDTPPFPLTAYGQSKLKAERYISDTVLPEGKKVYILRPCMIHGPGNKGNLNLLISVVRKGIPYPLGAFDNSRSFLSVVNFCFIIKEILISGPPPGTYNVADDEPLSTNELITLIGEVLGKKAIKWKINKALMFALAKAGDKLKLPFNSERLEKLTASYVVSNVKIIKALGKSLPLSSREGLIRTLTFFKKNNN